MQLDAEPAPAPSEPLALTLPPALVDLIVAQVAQVAERLASQRQPAAEPWVGVDEVAAHLGCKRQRIYDLVCRRASTGIPHRKEGSRLLFRLSQIDRWIDSGAAG